MSCVGSFKSSVSHQNNATPLYVASQKGHQNVVHALLNARANVNTANAVSCFVFQHVYSVKKLLACKIMFRLMYFPCSYKFLPVLQCVSTIAHAYGRKLFSLILFSFFVTRAILLHYMLQAGRVTMT